MKWIGILPNALLSACYLELIGHRQTLCGLPPHFYSDRLEVLFARVLAALYFRDALRGYKINVFYSDKGENSSNPWLLMIARSKR